MFREPKKTTPGEGRAAPGVAVIVRLVRTRISCEPYHTASNRVSVPVYFFGFSAFGGSDFGGGAECCCGGGEAGRCCCHRWNFCACCCSCCGLRSCTGGAGLTSGCCSCTGGRVSCCCGR